MTRATPTAVSRRLDPLGKRALFEAPVQAAPDTVRTGTAREGRAALFSVGPRQPGTVIIDCAACHSRTRVGLADIVGRLAAMSVWLPVRGVHPHLIKCPSCRRRTWCRIGWTE